MDNTIMLKQLVVPIAATGGVAYLWMEYGAYAPDWWLLSIVIIFVGNYLAYFRKKNHQQRNEALA
jgi:hypothetical protein